MKEIKFRAWAIASEKMFYPDESDGWGLMSGSLFTLPNTELMQYTGLKDKNGKDIYEGDINADYDNKKSEVVFYAGGFYLKYSKTEYKHIGSFAPFNLNSIGNIYENKDLLTN